MKRTILTIAATVFTVLSTAALSQTRTWVSGTGDDLNPCSRTAPCKTFASAINKTGTNGEINCLDSAGFGTVNITKSITIDCHSEHGGVLAANTNGVIVNGVNIVVTLRGLVIQSTNTLTGNGIRIINAAAVNIDDTIIENFGGTGTNGRGIVIETSGIGVRVNVTDSHLYNNNNHGIHSFPTAGSVFLTVDNVNIERGGASAIQLRQNTTANINDSNLSSHTVGAGVVAETSSVIANVSNSLLGDNAHGVINGSTSAATMRLYGNTITGNSINGLLVSSGSVLSYGNNAIRGNAGNETPTGVSLGTQ